MLGRGEHGRRGAEFPLLAALLSPQKGRSQLRHQGGILAESLVRAAPADVLGHGHARGEIPGHPGGPHFDRRRAADFIDQVRVARRPQADIVREDDGALDVIVPVHAVGAVEERNAQPCLESLPLKTVGHVGPGLGSVRQWISAAPAQNPADSAFTDVRAADAVLLHQGHLADFLLKRHSGEKIGDAVLDSCLRVLVNA